MTRQYAETILNSLSAHIAIIDGTGTIMETNRAWQRFANSNDTEMHPDMVSVNYLDICDVAGKNADIHARNAARGIRRVIQGEIEEFVMDYPCHSPEEQRWFYMRAIRVPGADPLQVVISHENITPLKLAEQKILEREEELAHKTERLGEANAALRALIRQRDEDIKEMETTFFRNLSRSVFPYVDELRQRISGKQSLSLIDMIESGLKQIASPFLGRIAHVETLLTPQEIKIASMIRAGRSSKEIADLLNLSMTTINFHRRNLRDKLGLKNTGTSLNTYLLSLE